MQCSSCGFENQEGMNFCGQCGATLANTCPSCGFTNPSDHAFCGKCGTSLANQTPVPNPTPETPPATAHTPPLAYTPQHLTEKILTARSALGGERKQVTVCFVDILVLLFDAARDAAPSERKGALCMAKSKVLYEATLQDIVHRIVEVTHPDKIILFGSAARGEMGPHSDVDLLVVKRGEFDQSRLVGDIYMNLLGLNQAVDVLLVTPEQLEQYGDTHCLVIAPALREGKEVYHAGSAATG